VTKIDDGDAERLGGDEDGGDVAADEGEDVLDAMRLRDVVTGLGFGCKGLRDVNLQHLGYDFPPMGLGVFVRHRAKGDARFLESKIRQAETCRNKAQFDKCGGWGRHWFWPKGKRRGHERVDDSLLMAFANDLKRSMACNKGGSSTMIRRRHTHECMQHHGRRHNRSGRLAAEYKYACVNKYIEDTMQSLASLQEVATTARDCPPKLSSSSLRFEIRFLLPNLRTAFLLWNLLS